MEEKIKIIDFNREFLLIFEKYKKIIKKILPTSKIYLIGSSAVPMKGKEEIDILIETDNPKEAQRILFKEGFSKGFETDNKIYHMDFRFGIECQIHLVEKGNKWIKRHLDFIKKLQKNHKIRKELEKLKEECDGLTKDEYKKRKNKFIQKYIE